MRFKNQGLVEERTKMTHTTQGRTGSRLRQLGVVTYIKPKNKIVVILNVENVEFRPVTLRKSSKLWIINRNPQLSLVNWTDPISKRSTIYCYMYTQ